MDQQQTGLAVLQTGGTFLVPAAPLQTMLMTYQTKKDFITAVLKEKVDYGTIPGAGEKPALFKPGAEKMTSFFGLAPIFEDVQVTEDWTGAMHNGEAFLYYRQRCKLFLGDRMIGAADGSCNSWESKYRYRWVPENEVPAGMDKTTLHSRGGQVSEFTFAVDKAETSGKYGKPAAYWQQFKDAIANGTAVKIKKSTKDKTYDAWQIGATLYRVPNQDVSDAANTILKMAQKRALVAAVLIATNVSDYFTQDIEDYVDGDYSEVVSGGAVPAAQPTPPAKSAAQPAPEPPATPAPGQAEQAAQGDYYPAVLAIVADIKAKMGLYTRMPAISEKQANMLAPILEAVFAPGDVEAKRHAALRAITGHTSLKEIDMSVKHDLWHYLKPYQDTGGEWKIAPASATQLTQLVAELDKQNQPALI